MDITNLTKRSVIRRETDQLDDSDVRKLVRHLEHILAERAHTRKVEAEKARARKAEIDKITALMRQAGVTPDEVTAAFDKAPTTSTKTQRAAPTPKALYSVIDEHGQEVTWSGIGRPPRAIAEKLKAGAKKEDFIVEQTIRLAS